MFASQYKKFIFFRPKRYSFQRVSDGGCCLPFGCFGSHLNVYPNLYEVNKSYFDRNFFSFGLECFLIKHYPATMSSGKHKYVPESVLQRHDEREAFHICNATQIG